MPRSVHDNYPVNIKENRHVYSSTKYNVYNNFYFLYRFTTIHRCNIGSRTITVRLGQYIDGWPIGKVKCRKLGYVGSELLIAEPSCNSNWIGYIDLRTNSLGKGRNPPPSPSRYGLRLGSLKTPQGRGCFFKVGDLRISY